MRTSALLLGVMLLGCQTTKSSPASSINQENLESTARAVLTSFTAANYAEATKDFDATMLAALPAPKLAEFAQQFNAQVGAFKSVGTPIPTTEQGYRVITLPAQYERANVNVRVVFDPNGKVAGLFFRPAG